MNTPWEGPWPSPVAGAVFPVLKLRNHSGETALLTQGHWAELAWTQGLPGTQTQLELFCFSIHSPWSQLLFNIVKGK